MVALVLTLAAAVVACGDKAEDRVYPPSPNRPVNRSCNAIEPPPPSGVARLVRAFDHALELGNRDLRKATTLAQSPADPEEWFLATQPGQIYRFSSDSSDRRLHLALDLDGRIDLRHWESGLVSLALHPDFASNGYGYVVYSAPNAEAATYVSRLSRITRAADGTFDPDSELVLMELEQFAGTHNGNHIEFDASGMLLYSVGDDKGRNVHPQNPATLYGKVLRIDVDRDDPGRGTAYSIPADNPFATSGGAPEVYAYGLRNPWRFTVDPEDGAIYLGDVGRDNREEIDEIVAGGNYGWPMREGTLCFSVDPCDDGDLAEQVIDPIVEFTHGEGRAVVAGHRYRKSDIPALTDRYVYADYITGNIWSIPLGVENAESRLEVEGQFNISHISQGRDGSLYFVRYAPQEPHGGVYQLAPNTPQPSAFPALLSETGCTDPKDPRQPAPGVIPYRPIAPLWSDGAAKERFLAIPDDRRIAVAAAGDFRMPPGTVLVKHFRFGQRYHETRLLMRYGDEWYGYTYRWNDAQTDAELLPTAIASFLPNGTRWQYPARTTCMECHTDAAGRTLGLEIAQLDNPVQLPGSAEPQNQLAWLWEHDYFIPDITSIDELAAGHASLEEPHGAAALDDRARSYLHANCSSCHRPGGPGRGEVDLRFTTPWPTWASAIASPKRAGYGASATTTTSSF